MGQWAAKLRVVRWGCPDAFSRGPITLQMMSPFPDIFPYLSPIYKPIKYSWTPPHLRVCSRVILHCCEIQYLEVDAIVNAANPDLANGAGVCGAIFRKAGASDLEYALSKYTKPIRAGQVCVTDGLGCPAKKIFHAVGPNLRGSTHRKGSDTEQKKLRDCYLNCLKLCLTEKCRTIAFPSISTGIYHFDWLQATEIAFDTIRSFLSDPIHQSQIDAVIITAYNPKAPAHEYARFLPAMCDFFRPY